MKKSMAFLLAVMMVLSLAACGSKEPPADTDKQQPKPTEFVRGVWDGSVYTNESIGFTLTLPEDWLIATDEELAEIMGLALESNPTTSEISEEFLKAQTTYDAMAQDPATGANVIIMAENLALSVGGTSYDEVKYSEVLINGLPVQQPDYNYQFAEGENITLGDTAFYKVTATALDGMLTQNYYFQRVGKHMAVIVVSYSPSVTDAAAIDSMLGGV